eukprot:gene16667-8105_t
MSEEESKALLCSASTQTTWSWLEDLKSIGRDSVPTQNLIENNDTVKIDTDDHSISNASLPEDSVSVSSTKNEPIDAANDSGDRSEIDESFHPDKNPTPAQILDGFWSGSDSESTELDTDYETDSPFPGVGPPQMLKLLRKEKYSDHETSNDGSQRHSYGIEKGFHKSFFSGPCQFCGEGVLPLPTVQEIETLPNNQLFCCSEYEEFVKLYITYVDKKKVEDEVIDIKPHAPYGTKAARKAAKERAAERMREKEMEKQKAVTAQANFFSFARQVKTIQYALSSVKCMQDGWTVRPKTPPVQPLRREDDEFSIDVNTSLLQKRNELYEKFYENGKRFLIVFPDGTGSCYYPSGNVAVIITSCELGKYTYILQKDTDDYDTEDPGVLGVFEPKGNASCYFKDSSLRMVLTPYGGMQVDKAGNYKKKWNWYFIKGHVHTPPFQPICFALNKQLSCRVMEQDHIVITFTSDQRAVRFNVGAKLKAIKQTIPPISKRDDHQQFLDYVRKRVQNIQDKIQLTMKFPKSPKLETLVAKTQASASKRPSSTPKLQTPKLKAKDPSVVVN